MSTARPPEGEGTPMRAAMASHLFYDTLRLNRGAGGVLNVAEMLLRSMRSSPGVDVAPVSARHPRLFALARRIGLSRFLLEVLLYNAHLVSAQVSGRRLVSLFPNYFLPFALFGRHRDAIVIVHDLQYKTYPEHFSRAKRLWLDWNLRRVARSQAHVVFISRSSQQDFERHFGRCHRPSVIFNPVDAAVPPAPADGTVRGERYLIAPYHYYPHKNFGATLRLFARMKCYGLVDWLDITGNGAAEVARMAAAVAPALRDSVRHRGMLPRDELIRLYLGASAFISLSTFEGFNLSAAEAAMLGVPLLLSDIPVHRELFGGYAFFVGDDACDLDCLSRYLSTHQQLRPAWSHAPDCQPAAVASRYLMLERDAAAASGAPL
ncbi:glycosyltransferase [Xylophilus sp.]|uniref:glycosyltransferase n=1 Tax=Xylophilus sp. TaxID=2653893 RepID=UPI0013BC5DEA|nr:glycosyltransferase [Xylophilus sp.]KAF1048065.1 MAG: hypothetical protein GAK38_01536 [Xylophilus sp.]